MLEWGGFPGDTGTRRIAWKGWKVMNDWNVRNVSGRSGTTGMSGKTGKTGMSGISGKTGMSGMSGKTGVPLEGLAAGMPGMSLEGLVRHTNVFLEDLLAFYA